MQFPMVRQTAIVLCFSVFFIGCDPFGSDGGGDSHFDVIVSGDISAQFQGSSTFGTFFDPESGLLGTIIIMSATGNDQRAVNFSGLTSGQVQATTYPIIEAEPGETFEPLEQDEFTATFINAHGEFSDIISSQIGQIAFSNSSDNTLEGSFSFEGMGLRITEHGNEQSDTVEVWVTVEGQFTSVRGAVL